MFLFQIFGSTDKNSAAVHAEYSTKFYSAGGILHKLPFNSSSFSYLLYDWTPI